MRKTEWKPFFVLPAFFICFLTARFTIEDDFNLPPDFGKAETIILVSPGSKDKITESIQEAFEKEYSGKFEFIQSQYPPSGKYAPEKYRFTFFVTEKSNPGQWIGKERFPPTTDYKFGLMDRQTGKSYQQDFWSGSYKKGARNYVKKMEEARKKNGE
jgi:hypothetical protein